MHWITPQRRQRVDRTMADLIITACPTTSSDTVPLPLAHQQVSPANQFDKTQPLIPLTTKTQGHKGRSHLASGLCAFCVLVVMTLYSTRGDAICHFSPIYNPSTYSISVACEM